MSISSWPRHGEMMFNPAGNRMSFYLGSWWCNISPCLEDISQLDMTIFAVVMSFNTLPAFLAKQTWLTPLLQTTAQMVIGFSEDLGRAWGTSLALSVWDLWLWFFYVNPEINLRGLYFLLEWTTENLLEKHEVCNTWLLQISSRRLLQPLNKHRK